MNAITKKEAFIQLFVKNALTICLLRLKEITFPLQIAVATLNLVIFFCSYCSRLKHSLNYIVKKACILISDKEKLPFNIDPIYIYLHKKIKAPPMFYLYKIKNDAIVRLDNMVIFVIFLLAGKLPIFKK